MIGPIGALVFALPPAADVEESLRTALAAGERAVAVVILVEPQEGERPGTIGIEIDALQDAVLGRLADLGGEFELRYRYEHFAALTGVVDARTLEILAGDLLVRRIGSDLEGAIVSDTAVPFSRGDRVRELAVRGAGVTVAVLDTGIDTDHPDLAAGIAPGARHFLQQGADVGPGAEDGNGHGTNVSGIISADGLVAPLGIAPDASILPVQVVGANGSGFTSDWAAGMDYVTSQRAARPDLLLVNISLATTQFFSDCPCDSSLAAITLLAGSIDAAKSAGVTTFVATGNRGECGQMPAPACIGAAASVVAVYDVPLGREPDSSTYQAVFGGSFGNCFDAATAPGQVTCFANANACAEFAGPGAKILSSFVGGGSLAYTGTSQASPHVAGIAALAQSVAGTPRTPDALLALLADTAFDVAVPCAAPTAVRRPDALAAVAAANAHPLVCFGDGSGGGACASCPCSNQSGANTPGGCMHSAGTSAILFARGTASLASDDLRFEIRRSVPAGFAVLFSGAQLLPQSGPCTPGAGVASALLDGLRCVGSGVVRHGVRASDAAGAVGAANSAWGPPDGPIGGLLAQGAFSAGSTRAFQAFFRENPAAGCGRGQNTTNAALVSVVP